MLSAPLFFELDALINDDSEKKTNIRHDGKKERQTRNRKERQKTHRISRDIASTTASSSCIVRRAHRIRVLVITHHRDGEVHRGGGDIGHVLPEGDGFA